MYRFEAFCTRDFRTENAVWGINCQTVCERCYSSSETTMYVGWNSEAAAREAAASALSLQYERDSHEEAPSLFDYCESCWNNMLEREFSPESIEPLADFTDEDNDGSYRDYGVNLFHRITMRVAAIAAVFTIALIILNHFTR